MFSGSIPALATPFCDGTFAEGIFRDFIEWQIAEGSAALVPCGTTGEAATMSIDEHNHIIAVCVDQAAGRVPVIAGCGSNDTKVALAHMHAAKKAGADAALVVPPYYNRPNQRGILAHFEMLAKGCDLPIIAYNVPARTVTDINCDTMAHMANAGWIKGVKDATGELDRVGAHRGACGADFCQLSGNDDIALGHYAMGGAGCVSVSANVAPRLCADFQAALTKGDMAAAQALQDKLFPLHKALFSDASPGPVKYALSKVRADFPLELRLPMTAPSAESCAIVDAALAHADLV